MLGNGSFVASMQIPDLAAKGARAPQLVFMKSVSSLCRTYLLSQACPDMKFVHILRHPCAYVASTLRGKKLGLLSDDAYIETLANMSHAERYGLTLKRLRAMGREEQLAARWMLHNEKVMLEMQGNSNFIQVIYEDLCNSPEATAEGLFSFLGLPMHENTLRFIAESSGETPRKCAILT